MPAYKPPKSSFARALEREMFGIQIDLALNLNVGVWDCAGSYVYECGRVLDDMIHWWMFWEVQTQETVDTLAGIAAWLPAWCPDCKLTMTYAERDEGRRRCASCEALPYAEWCALTGVEPHDERLDGTD